MVKVIVFPDSPMDSPVLASNVTAALPEVFELITLVVPVPAVTDSAPSFVTDPSTSALKALANSSSSIRA